MSRRRSARNQSQGQRVDSSSVIDGLMMDSQSVFQTPGSVVSVRHASLSQSVSERFSHDEILRLLVNDVDTLERMYSELAAEHSHIVDAEESVVGNTSNNTSQVYTDILHGKASFVNQLSQAIASFQDNPSGILKFSNLGLIEMLNLFKQRFAETKENVARDTDLLKKKLSESAELSSQINLFRSLVEDDEENDEDTSNNNKFAEARSIFQEAKNDLDVVLTHTFPSEADKKKFSQAMSALVNQYVENLDCKEAQYVQIVPDILKSTKLIRSLILNCVVTEHPEHKGKFRLSIS